MSVIAPIVSLAVAISLICDQENKLDTNDVDPDASAVKFIVAVVQDKESVEYLIVAIKFPLKTLYLL